ncbi:reverse transcriptase domain-containing protein [Clostridioides difficile]|jgi:group II intron reverse transcriptase/maturase|uniref:reverse transcriptase domain-containing protein n=1 Tax=Clostridioides difficile TaxID=1496 RepID=UPI001123E300|nr:reverse transcriptase domain-containing protein [Clostridioides difficile]TOY67944.1 group II intron reverse transcriptase/maturase [Clostridioides difficile]HBF2126024.1 group II intron reverse transcriptase/maturase [Clostridioides difficile]HBG3248684.1 group II intron reverse transcriptase/maturase [Clostridioides difficile]HBG4426446.1 group II intron reverse transcriptase/maturase [Clostridioides difficile]HBY2830813.1 group II intron reverse transcriptase/maturase [Clostridioides dif
MKPTMEILTKLQENSKKNHDEVFTRLYRYLLRPDIYYVAYQHLYSNKGAGTKGVTDDTADGFSEIYIENIIEALKNEMYQPKPVRRTYIKKSNGKMRPLGLPVFTDKLIQEAIRMILEAIYEPIFSDYSHGFRPARSCHTALAQIKKEFTGARWFIEGDIKGCFDNINHAVLVEIINQKIKDARFLKLIRSFLKAGYMEDWKYHETYSGCPQGGIISPILANIYLNELDRHVMKIKKEFDVATKARYTPEYTKLVGLRQRLHNKIKNSNGIEREKLIEEYKTATAQMLKLPAKQCDDKKIKYVRYADDFLIAVNGNRQDCEKIKQELTEFISTTLKMELSQEKTLITHSNTPARFLGYDVRVRRDQQIKPKGKFKTRSMNNKVELSIPFKDKIEKFLFSNGIVKQRSDNGKLEPIHRPQLLNRTDLEIVTIYNAELRGICNYYGLASNFNKLIYFNYLMEYSCLKTLAGKHRSKVSKIRAMYKDGTGKWAVPYETKTGIKKMYFANYADCKGKKFTDIVPQTAKNYSHDVTTLESRLKAKICEVCGCTESDRYEIHHVNKVKNLKGKSEWEKIMIAKRRKTIVVCHKCHMAIHHGEKK